MRDGLSVCYVNAAAAFKAAFRSLDSVRAILAAAALLCTPACSAQVAVSGRIALDPSTGSSARVFFGGVLCFGTITEAGVESRGFRSWETEPAGWFRLSGPAGNYTLLFTQPAKSSSTKPRRRVGSWSCMNPTWARDGDFEVADPGVAGDSVPASWKSFATEGRLRSTRQAEPPENTNHFARLQPGEGKIVDGGWVQRVTGLDPMETYRLGGRVRASYAVDADRQCYVGCDPTGQETDPRAATIRWATLPPRHGEFVSHLSEPIRPLTNSVSLWLRARVASAGERYAPFTADFDDVTLRQVRTDGPP